MAGDANARAAIQRFIQGEKIPGRAATNADSALAECVAWLVMCDIAAVSHITSQGEKGNKMSEQSWIDPWLALREKTATRNELLSIADRYSKMQRLAMAQLNDLRQRPKTKPETLAQLEEIIRFCGDKGQPLFDKIGVMDAELREATERMQSEQET